MADLGETVTLYTELRNDAGTLTDATVVLTLYKPDGTDDTPDVEHSGTGLYNSSFEVDGDGDWLYVWTASGAIAPIDQGRFTVDDVPGMARRAYCSLDDVREQLNDGDGHLSDAHLQRAVNAASRAVDEHCGRRFWKDAAVTVRYYRAPGVCVANVDDIADTTGLIVQIGGPTTWTTLVVDTDYELGPLNADADGAPYAWTRIVPLAGAWPTAFPDRLKVTALHGWSSVPAPVREATVLRATALFKRKDSPLGVAGFGDFGSIRITREDPDVKALLAPFRKLQPGLI